MVHQMRLYSVLYADEITHENYPQIRQFFIPSTSEFHDDLLRFISNNSSRRVAELVQCVYFFHIDLDNADLAAALA